MQHSARPQLRGLREHPAPNGHGHQAFAGRFSRAPVRGACERATKRGI